MLVIFFPIGNLLEDAVPETAVQDPLGNAQSEARAPLAKQPNEPKSRVQRGKHQKRAKKKVQAGRGTKRTETQNTARQAPKTSHEEASHWLSTNVSTTSDLEPNPLVYYFERISCRLSVHFQCFGSQPTILGIPTETREATTPSCQHGLKVHT